jgi:pilus assembly protein CpaB
MRRAIAVAIALLLAAFGTFLLVRFVQSARDNATEGLTMVSVLVVETEIPRGTPATEIADQVASKDVWQELVAEGAVSDLATLGEKVAAVTLLPGEQVVSSRFVEPEDYGEVYPAPADMVQVTLSLSPERVVGGVATPGDKVAIFASFDSLSLNTVEPTGLSDRQIATATTTTQPGQQGLGSMQSPASTKLILFHVLVTNIQAEEAPRETTETTLPGTPELAPTGNLLVTVALLPGDAERLVFAAEHGSVWLAAEGETVDDQAPTQIQTRSTIYEPQ